jgi:hypothetical protein
MISDRWVGAIMALVVAALVPTVLHSYVDWRVDNDRPATEVPLQLDEFAGVSQDAGRSWLRDGFAAIDWIHREYTAPGAIPVSLLVARSFDAKRLFHHPEKAVPYARFTEPVGVVQIASNGRYFPVHLLRGESGAVAAYCLVYDGDFVASSLLFQFRLARQALVQPRKPMTLLFAYDSSRKKARRTEQSPAVRLVVAATREYLQKR